MLCQRGRNTRVVARLCALTAALCALGALFVGSASAQAQEGAGLEPSEEQYRLNEKGTRAYERKKYDKALEFYEEALALGELNTLYLNLARTYQRLGKCVDAELTFRKALAAPAVIDPPADKVREAVKRFRADDKEVCYGRLTLSCDLEGMKVVLNDDEEVPCDGVERPAPPGPYKIVASGWGQERTFTAEVKPGEGSDVGLTLGISASEAKAWDLVEEARGELASGALEGAGAKLTEAVGLNDGWWEPHALLGEVAQRQDRLEDAREHLTQALARSPDAQRGQLEAALAGIEREIKARQPVDVVSDAPVAAAPEEKSTLGGWLLLSAGVASMAAGGFFASQVADTNDKINEADLARLNADRDVAFGGDGQAESNEQTREVERLTQEGEQQRLMANIGLGVGAGMMAGGLLWVIINSGSSEAEATGQREEGPVIEPMVTGDGFGASMHWSW